MLRCKLPYSHQHSPAQPGSISGASLQTQGRKRSGRTASMRQAAGSKKPRGGAALSGMRGLFSMQASLSVAFGPKMRLHASFHALQSGFLPADRQPGCQHGRQHQGRPGWRQGQRQGHRHLRCPPQQMPFLCTRPRFSRPAPSLPPASLIQLYPPAAGMRKQAGGTTAAAAGKSKKKAAPAGGAAINVSDTCSRHTYLSLGSHFRCFGILYCLTDDTDKQIDAPCCSSLAMSSLAPLRAMAAAMALTTAHHEPRCTAHRQPNTTTVAQRS
jgi:hypothetical protein